MPPSRARAAGARSAFSEYMVKMKTEGIAKAMSQVSKFGKSIEQLSQIHKSSVKSSQEFDWASQSLGKTNQVLQAEVSRISHLFGLYQQELKDVGDGIAKASSLNNDQLEVMDELAKSLDKLLKKKNIDKELNEATLYLLQRRRRAIAETRVEVAKLRDVEEKLSIATKFMGEAWADSFGKLTSGSKDAEKVMGIIGRSASKIAPLMKPHLDKVKRQLIDTFMQKFDLGVDEGGIADALKKFTTKATKKKPEDIALKGKIAEYTSPGKSIGDVKKMADAVGKLQKSGTKAGAGMAKATKGMAGAAKAGTKVGIVTEGVGKAMAKTGAKTAAKVGAMTALKGAVGAILPPLGALLLILDGVSMAMGFLSDGIDLNIENMERFRRVAFRASGSMRELLDTSSDLSMSLGASSEQAYGTTQAIAEAGFAVDSLGEKLRSTDGAMIGGQAALLRLAKANLKFAEATGASAIETAKLQKRFDVMNVSVEEQEAALGALSQAAAKYMLTAEDMSAVIQTLTKNSIQLETVWSNTNIYDYTKAMGALAGASKQLGFNMSVANEFASDVANTTNKALILASQSRGGVAAFFGTDLNDAMLASAEGAKNTLEGLNKIDSAIVRNRKAAVFGGIEYLRIGAATYDELMKEKAIRAAMSDEQIARDDEMIASRKALTENYEKSTETIKTSFQRIAAPIRALFAKISGPFIDAIAGMASYVVPVVEEIISAFDTLWTGIKDVFIPFMPALRAIGKIIWLVVIVAVYILTSAIKLLGVALSVIGKLIGYIFAPLVWATQLIEAFVDLLISGVELGGKWVNKLVDGFWSLMKPITAFMDKWTWLIEGIIEAKRMVFGSSFLHIGEGVKDVLPTLDKLSDGFENTAKSALKARDAAGDIQIDPELKTAKILDDLISGRRTFQMPSLEEFTTMPGAEGGKAAERPMGAYPVTFRGDISKDQIKSQSEANTSILEIHRLIKEYMGRDMEEQDKKVTEAVERLERKYPDMYNQQPVGRPRRPGGRRPGAQLKRTY